jgi:fatty acid desaturase
LDGCSVRVVPIDVRIPGSPNCSYRLDLVLILIPALLALLLIAGAWRYLRSDRFSRLATALAALAAIVAAVFPVYAVWWLIDYYRLALGVTELLLAGAALAVLGVAVLAAWRTVEALKRSERP